jgi:hypothetical protein
VKVKNENEKGGCNAMGLDPEHRLCKKHCTLPFFILKMVEFSNKNKPGRTRKGRLDQSVKGGFNLTSTGHFCDEFFE